MVQLKELTQNLQDLRKYLNSVLNLKRLKIPPLKTKLKKYEFGIGDAGELEYKFAYKNDGVSAPYRVLRTAADNKTKLFFEQAYPDGTKVKFEGQVSVKLGGGGVNSVIEFTLKIALQSELEFTDGIGG